MVASERALEEDAELLRTKVETVVALSTLDHHSCEHGSQLFPTEGEVREGKSGTNWTQVTQQRFAPRLRHI